MTDRAAYIDKLSAQLKEWDAEIKKMEAKLEAKKAESKLSYEKKIETLKDKKKSLSARLEEIENSSNEAWESLKDGTDKIVNDFKQTFQDVVSKF